MQSDVVPPAVCCRCIESGDLKEAFSGCYPCAQKASVARGKLEKDTKEVDSTDNVCAYGVGKWHGFPNVGNPRRSFWPTWTSNTTGIDGGKVGISFPTKSIREPIFQRAFSAHAGTEYYAPRVLWANWERHEMRVPLRRIVCVGLIGKSPEICNIVPKDVILDLGWNSLEVLFS